MKQPFKNHLYLIGALLVLAGIFSFAMIEGGFVSWFLFYGFLVVTLYTVGAYLYSIRRWEVTRVINETYYEAGDTVDIEIHLKRKIPFPIFYAFCEEELNPSLQQKDPSNEKFKNLGQNQPMKEKVSFVSLLPIVFKRSIVLKYSIPYIPRGAHELHTITLKTSDLFGCIKKEAVFHHKDYIQVYPRVRPVTYINEARSFEQDSGSHSSVIKGIQSTLSTGVREYEAGDRLAWIDWKQTAKTNEIMTKEFEREQDTSVLFIFDHQWYEGMNMLAFEGAIETTVAMIHDIYAEATYTALLSIGAEVESIDLDHITFTNGHLAEHFMKVVPEVGEPFAKQLEQHGLNRRKQTLTCIVSSRITEEMMETVGKLHDQLGEMMFVCVMSKQDQTPEVQQRFDQMQAQGIQVCILSEEELIKDPIEVVGYGKNEPISGRL